MPTYRVTAPDGRNLKLEGDSPPTEAELEEVFSKLLKRAEAPARVEAGTIGGMTSISTNSPGARFIGGVWENVNPVNIAKGLYGAVTSPGETVRAAGAQLGEQWEKAGNAWNEGRISEAVGHGVAGSIPLIGPAAAAAGERIGEGDVAGGLGAGTGLIASMLLPRAVGKGVKATVPVLNKIRAPFAGAIDPAVEAAARRVPGVELPASSLSTSPVVPLAETVSAKGIGGGATAARYTGAATALKSRADQLVSAASRYATESQRGVAIANGYKAFRQHWIQVKNALYKDAAIPENATATANSTVRLLDDVIAQKQGAANISGGATDLGFFQKLREGLSSGPVSLKDMRAAIQDLNGKIGGAHADAWSAANKQLLKKLAATMDEDFGAALQTAAPDVAAKLKVANAAYADGLSKINSTFGKSITKLAKAGQFDDIARSVANSGVSVDDVPRIFEVVGAEGTQAIRASVLADIVRKATNAQGQLTPQGLARAMKQYGDRSPGALEAMLDPEQLAKLNDLSTLSGSLEKGARVMGGSQTAPLVRAGGLAQVGWVNPIAALQLLLGDMAVNKFIGSAAGQKWLTKGFKPLTAPNVDTVGNRLGTTATNAAGVTLSPSSMQPVPQGR